MSLASFSAKKRKILQQLSVPDDSYSDASPKGTVDEGIRGFMDEINSLESLVTTSSCAGRIAVYLEGKKQASRVIAPEEAPRSGGGGKGGGQWLFVSHDPLDTSRIEGSVSPMFGLAGAEPSVPASIQDVRWVRCKFEPFILHVLCSSIESAQRVHTAAAQSGFRESGISSISADDLQSTTAMVAVRTTGLAFDSVVGYETAEGKLVPMVTEGYMRLLVNLANERFQTNKERIERFRNALLGQFTTSEPDSTWEPIEQRRARMKKEGLERQARAMKPPASETQQEDDDTVGLNMAF